MPRDSKANDAAKAAVAKGVEELSEQLAEAAPGDDADEAEEGSPLEVAQRTVQRHELDLILSGEHDYYGSVVAERMRRALAGSGMNPDAFNSTLVNIVTNSPQMRVPKDPELAQATYRSVIVAGLNAATLRLAPQPQAGQVWFVPFNTNFPADAKAARDKLIKWDQVRSFPAVQTIVGYQGYVTLGYRSGAVRDIAAGFIWPGQPYETDGIHSLRVGLMPPGWKPGPDDEPDYVFFQVRTTTGGEFLAVQTYTELLEAREYSASYRNWLAAKSKGWRRLPDSPWVDHERAMVKKTAVRWNRGMIPLGDASSPAQAAFAHAFVVDGSVGGLSGGDWLPSGDPGAAWAPDWAEEGGGQMQDVIEVHGPKPAGGVSAKAAAALSDDQLLAAIREKGKDLSEAQDVAVDHVLTAWGLPPMETFETLMGKRPGDLPGDRALLIQLYEALS